MPYPHASDTGATAHRQGNKFDMPIYSLHVCRVDTEIHPPVQCMCFICGKQAEFPWVAREGLTRGMLSVMSVESLYGGLAGLLTALCSRSSSDSMPNSVSTTSSSFCFRLQGDERLHTWNPVSKQERGVKLVRCMVQQTRHVHVGTTSTPVSSLLV